ncbi:MAG TPA: ABC transporter ATP-binding protein [Candidatus Saccharimonadales bacterium]|nr:ABC transporter ATP-binding protein [Candidatus Saccharimonadales bacterium]
MADKTESTAIKVERVYKDFVLPHERISNVKGFFTNIFNSSALKTKETQHALKDVSFEIKKGEFFGIVGRNGSGKSTMLKMLAGIYQPTKGAVHIDGKLVPFIELGVGFNPELTGRENVYLNGALLGFSTKEIEAQYNDIVKFAELERFMDQKLKNYSSGMQVRLAFSMATRAKADILLVDEVLAVGDADFQRKCFDYFRTLKRNKKTVVFVSHDMSAVREYCDRAVLIEKSEIIAAGDADEIATKYTRMFLEADKASKEGSTKRWGDGKITYDSIKMSLEGKGETQKLVISAVAEAHEDIEAVNFGFLIRNGGGTAVLGTNSHIKRQFVERMVAGQKATVNWELANILNDGTYFVEPAVVHGGTQTGDWWEEAAWLEVRKEEQTPYPVNPPINLTLEVAGKKVTPGKKGFK